MALLRNAFLISVVLLLGRASLALASDNYYLDYQNMTSAQRMQAIQRVLAFAKSPPPEPASSAWKKTISRETAEALLALLNADPVASKAASDLRDKAGLGFCFGRAYFVHLRALGKDFRVAPSSIKKIWAVGTHVDPGNPNISRGHHVATMIAADDGGWWVIDSFTGVKKAEDWIKANQDFFDDSNHKTIFFTSSPSRFSPYNSLPYRKIDLDDPSNFYANYFNELRANERDRILRQINEEELRLRKIHHDFLPPDDSNSCTIRHLQAITSH